MVLGHSSNQSNSTDVIVVGAGSSGSAVIRRRIDAGLRVTALEGGPPDDRETIHDPAGNIMELFGSEYDKSNEYLPQPHAAGRTIPQSKGRILGGSNAINDFIYVRGNVGDYNHWAALGVYGWDWASVESYYCCLKSYSEGDGGGAWCRRSRRCTARTRINAITALHWGLFTRRDAVEKVFSPPAVTGAGSSS